MIYVLVAVFNRAEITKQFLKSLKLQTYSDQPIQLVLVNDGSTDDTVEVTKKLYPDVKIIEGPGDWWWSYSMYKGCEYILSVATDDDYVLMANNDQVSDPEALKILMETSARLANQLGPAVVSAISKKMNAPSVTYDSAQIIKWFKYTYHDIPSTDDQNEYTEPIDVLTCRFTLVPIQILRKVQFDPHYTQYFGDYDLFLNIKKLGYRLVLSYKAVIYDMGGPSGIQFTTKPTIKELHQRMFAINSHSNIFLTTYYLWKNCPSRLWSIILIMLLYGTYSLRLIKALIRSTFILFIRKTS